MTEQTSNQSSDLRSKQIIGLLSCYVQHFQCEGKIEARESGCNTNEFNNSACAKPSGKDDVVVSWLEVPCYGRSHDCICILWVSTLEIPLAYGFPMGSSAVKCLDCGCGTFDFGGELRIGLRQGDWGWRLWWIPYIG
jgi:hypothetical protein